MEKNSVKSFDLGGILVWIGWVLFFITGYFYITSNKYSHGKRIELVSYIIYLLLDDEVRDLNKKEMKKWIRDAKQKNSTDLALKAKVTIEDYAGQFSKHSILGAQSLLWNCEENEDSKKMYGGN